MSFQVEGGKLKRNIVFVLNEYNGHGGTQKVASILANAFIEDGHNVSVLSINEFDDDSSYFSDEVPITVLHENGYRAGGNISLMTSLKKRNIKNIVKESKRRKNLKKYKAKANAFFDKFGDEEVFVIVIQVWGMQWLEDLYYKKNVKIIGQSHESYIASKNTHRFKKLLTYYRMVEKFLVLSKKDVESFKKEGFENIDYILNPTSFTANNNPEILFNNNKIVSVGRLIPEKGFQDLISAFAEIHTDYPDWTLSIYGNGPNYHDLEKLIESLKLQGKVTLEGESNNIKDALNKSSFFVLPSYAEGLPMVLIEAQSCGLPCISTDCAPGIREIINEYKDGLICEPGNVERLSRHLETLISQKDIFMKYSHNALVNREKFSVIEIKNEWYSIFESLEEN